MKNDRYVIRGGVEGRERLRLLSDVCRPSTNALLDRVGIRMGAVCLDVGCGGGDVTVELARAAGPTGRALGLDLDETKLELARREAAQLGLANIAFEVRDVTTWDSGQRFDVVYARFLLTHLRDPGQMVSAMRRHLRPGGVVVVEDIDFRGHFAEPACPALERYVGFYTKSVQNRGADPNIGPRLPGLLRGAGLDDVQMHLVQPAALAGGMKTLAVVTLESIVEAVLADGLATEEGFRATITELDAFVRDPQTVLGGPRIFQAWGWNGAQAAEPG